MSLKFIALTTLLVVVSSEPPVLNQGETNEQSQPNPEAAYYKFSYDVHDSQTGDNKVHTETRDGDVVKGQYSFDDSDGTRRIVDYTADSVNGFKATIRKEPLPELQANTLEKTPNKNIPAPEKDAEILQAKQAAQVKLPQVQTFDNFGARVAQPNIVSVPSIPHHSVASKQTDAAAPENQIVRVTHYVPQTVQTRPVLRKQVYPNQPSQQPLLEVVKVESPPGAEKVYRFSQYISGPTSGNVRSAVSARQTELVDAVEVEAVPANPVQNPVQVPATYPSNFIQYAPVQSAAPVVSVYRPRANVVYERVTSPLSYTLV